MSKLLAGLVFASISLGVPVLSFAQSNAPLTRAEVRADLIRVEHAGYNPARGGDVEYPADIQAAEQKIAAQNDQPLTTQAFGGVAQNGTSASGAPAHRTMASNCVGPVSFCNLYFGS